MAINPLPLAGVGLTAVAIAGGLYATGTAKDNGNEIQQEPTKWHSLSEDSDYLKASNQKEVSEAYSGKYGQTYSIFLVGLTSKGENEAWWKWSFKNNYKDTATGGFAKETVKDWEQLRSACKGAYKGTLETNKPEVKEGTTVYQEADVWRFCTPFGEKVKTLKDMATGKEDYTSGTYGQNTTNRADLIATKEPTNKANEHFWSVKTEELKNDSTTVTSGTTNEFHKLKNKLKGQTNDAGSAQTTLKATCADAYGKTSSDSSTYPAADIAKFCSLSGKTPTTAG